MCVQILTEIYHIVSKKVIDADDKGTKVRGPHQGQLAACGLPMQAPWQGWGKEGGGGRAAARQPSTARRVVQDAGWVDAVAQVVSNPHGNCEWLSASSDGPPYTSPTPTLALPPHPVCLVAPLQLPNQGTSIVVDNPQDDGGKKKPSCCSS